MVVRWEEGYCISLLIVLYYRHGLSTRATQCTPRGVPHHLVSQEAAKVLVGAIKARLEQIIREVASEHGWTILELAIQPDHVHVFLRGDPYTTPSDIARFMKGRSSHDLREEFPELLKLPSLWTHSFFVSTAGNVSAETIQRYIERQSGI
jgi:putative transposase